MALIQIIPKPEFQPREKNYLLNLKRLRMIAKRWLQLIYWYFTSTLAFATGGFRESWWAFWQSYPFAQMPQRFEMVTVIYLFISSAITNLAGNIFTYYNNSLSLTGPLLTCIKITKTGRYGCAQRFASSLSPWGIRFGQNSFRRLKSFADVSSFTTDSLWNDRCHRQNQPQLCQVEYLTVRAIQW